MFVLVIHNVTQAYRRPEGIVEALVDVSLSVSTGESLVQFEGHFENVKAHGHTANVRGEIVSNQSHDAPFSRGRSGNIVTEVNDRWKLAQ